MAAICNWSREEGMTDLELSDSILAKAVRWRVLGKSPANFYLRLNEWIWRRLPSQACDLHLVRSYGAWLHNLVCLRARRQQYFGTFFLRNRPALELIRRLSEKKKHGATLSIAVLGCSIGAEVYSILFVIRKARPDLRVIMHAVDISEEILDFAQRGVYSPDACTFVGSAIFERLTAQEKQEMFDWKDNQPTIKKAFREDIIWKLGDAADAALIGILGLQDLVVASNFLCHMPSTSAEKCLRNMACLVARGGHIFVSGVDLDVRAKVAVDLGWKPIPELVEDVHNGDISVCAGWPWCWWGLEPLNRRRADWQTRYTAMFEIPQGGGEPLQSSPN
jgi:SAM-dependent methyltransferase